ncbi:hypothetical protein ACWGLG_16285 [Streptomyces antimycoticus]
MMDALASREAAQLTADRVVADIHRLYGHLEEGCPGGPLLRIAVTDVESGERLQTAIVAADPGRHLRLVGEA